MALTTVPWRRALLSHLTAAALLAFAWPLTARAELYTQEQCEQNVKTQDVRDDCVRCVTQIQPHSFYRREDPGYRCRLIDPKGEAIRTVEACEKHVRKSVVREQCVTCVTSPLPFGFLKRLPRDQRCHLLDPAPPAAAQTTMDECATLVGNATVRRDCYDCVSRTEAHLFLQDAVRGATCVAVDAPPEAAPVAPPPGAPPVEWVRPHRDAPIEALSHCHKYLKRPEKQEQCKRCIERGGHRYYPNAPADARCQATD